MLISAKKKPSVALLILCFLANTFSAAAFGGAINMPAASFYQPPLLKYLSINSANPHNYFNFLLDKGKGVPYSKLDTEADKTINYFFLGLTLKEDSFWVNLKPQEPDRMTSQELAKTDMGKALLNQDLLLKKDVAKYLHPDNFRGKEFWQRLYSAVGKARAKKMAFDSYNRVWIVPDKAVAVETEDGVLITEAKLKVLLESEYVAQSAKRMAHSEKNKNQSSSPYALSSMPYANNIDKITQSLMKEIIIPELTFDVNNSPRYASLRQVYHSLILAQYYKNKYRTEKSVYSGIINNNQAKGLESQYPWSKQKIWQDYLKSYEHGEYKVKSSLSGLKRMYFSGGITFFSSGINSLNNCLTVYSPGSALSNVEFNSSSPLPNMPLFWGTSDVSAESVGDVIVPKDDISFGNKQGDALIIDFIESILKQASMTLNKIIDALPLADEQWAKQADITPENASEKAGKILNSLIKQGKIKKETPGQSPEAKKAERVREQMENLEIRKTNLKGEGKTPQWEEKTERFQRHKRKNLKKTDQKKAALHQSIQELNPVEWERQTKILKLHERESELSLRIASLNTGFKTTPAKEMIENLKLQQVQVQQQLEELNAPIYIHTAASSGINAPVLEKEAMKISPPDTASGSSSSLIALSASEVLEAIGSLISEKKEEAELRNGNGQGRELRRIIKELSQLSEVIEDSSQREWNTWDVVDLIENETLKELLKEQMELTEISEERPEIPSLENPELDMWDWDVSDSNISSSIKRLTIEEAQTAIRNARSQLMQQLTAIVHDHPKLDTESEHLSQAINVLDNLSDRLREIEDDDINLDELIKRLTELIKETKNEEDVNTVLRKALSFSSNNIDVYSQLNSQNPSSSITLKLNRYLPAFRSIKAIKNIPNLDFFSKIEDETMLKITLPDEDKTRPNLGININHRTGEVTFESKTAELKLKDESLLDALEIWLDTEEGVVSVILTEKIMRELIDSRKPIPTMISHDQYLYGISSEYPNFFNSGFKFKLKDYLEAVKQMEEISKLPCVDFSLNQAFNPVLTLTDGKDVDNYTFTIDLNAEKIHYHVRKRGLDSLELKKSFEDVDLFDVFGIEADMKNSSLAMILPIGMVLNMEKAIHTKTSLGGGMTEERKYYVMTAKENLADPNGKDFLKSWEIKPSSSIAQALPVNSATPMTRKVLYSSYEIKADNILKGIRKITDAAKLSSELKLLKDSLRPQYDADIPPVIMGWLYKNTKISYEKNMRLTDDNRTLFIDTGENVFKISIINESPRFKAERISREESPFVSSSINKEAKTPKDLSEEIKELTIKIKRITKKIKQAKKKTKGMNTGFQGIINKGAAAEFTNAFKEVKKLEEEKEKYISQLENLKKEQVGTPSSSMKKQPAKTEIFEKVKRILVERFFLAENRIELTDKLEADLALDSMDTIYAANKIEKEFKISNFFIDKNTTVADVVDMIEEKLTASNSIKQSDEGIFEEMKEIFNENLFIDNEEITMDAELQGDLGIDSLDLMETEDALWKTFGVNIQNITYEGNETVRDIVNFIKEEIALSDSTSGAQEAPSSSIGGIDLNRIKVNIEQSRNLAPEEKEKTIAKLKTLYAVDALMNKKWDGLAYLYLQEILLLAQNDLIKDFDEQDKIKLAWVGNTLKEKGYINDSKTLKLIAGLKTNNP